MPLSILLPMVVIGIAGIAVLLHLLGLSRPLRFADAAAARAAWAREFPELPAERVILCHNHAAALIETAQGDGVVWPMGADSTGRLLNGARIEPTAHGVRLHLPDFTAPYVHLHLDPDEAALWLEKLEPAA
jgi:hypothetical protein